MSTSDRFLLPRKIHSGIHVLNTFSPWIKDYWKRGGILTFDEFWNRSFSSPSLLHSAAFAPTLRTAPINWGWTWAGFMVGLHDPKGLFQPKYSMILWWNLKEMWWLLWSDPNLVWEAEPKPAVAITDPPWWGSLPLRNIFQECGKK